MELIDTRSVGGPIAWSGPTITGFGDAAVKLRWIDRPFRWHCNSGREFFLVLTGLVEMRCRSGSGESATMIEAGQALIIEAGEEHVAHPQGPARVLVVEA